MPEPNKNNSRLIVAVELIFDILTAAVLFLVIAIIAIGIDWILQWLVRSFDVSDGISEPLSFVKTAIMFVDFILFGIFLISALPEAWRKLWK